MAADDGRAATAASRAPARTQVGSEEIRFLHFLERIPALDQDRSRFSRYPDGRIVSITKQVFIRSVVGDHHLFKVPEDSWTTFVSEPVERAIEASPLKGFLIEDAP